MTNTKYEVRMKGFVVDTFDTIDKAINTLYALQAKMGYSREDFEITEKK